MVPLYGVTEKNIDLILKEIEEEGKALAKIVFCIPLFGVDMIEDGYKY
jgi:hypothetical protein